MQNNYFARQIDQVMENHVVTIADQHVQVQRVVLPILMLVTHRQIRLITVKLSHQLQERNARRLVQTLLVQHYQAVAHLIKSLAQ